MKKTIFNISNFAGAELISREDLKEILGGEDFHMCGPIEYDTGDNFYCCHSDGSHTSLGWGTCRSFYPCQDGIKLTNNSAACEDGAEG